MLARVPGRLEGGGGGGGMQKGREEAVSPGRVLAIRGSWPTCLRLRLLPACLTCVVFSCSHRVVPSGRGCRAGLQYLSSHLRRKALNMSGRPLLSLSVEPVAAHLGGLVIKTANLEPGELRPRLKVKKHKDGTLELSLREVSQAGTCSSCSGCPCGR